MADLEFHELANKFPMIEGEAFDSLVSSIKRNGLIQPIVLLDGKILDGRNRYRACQIAGVTPDFIEFTEQGEEKRIELVDALNLQRRMLSESQRAMIAADLHKRGMPISSAAKAVAVSDRTVIAARTVLEEGDPKVVQLVRDGSVAVHRAAAVVRKDLPASDLHKQKVGGVTGRPRGNARVTKFLKAVQPFDAIIQYQSEIIAHWPGDPEARARAHRAYRFLASVLEATKEQDHAAAVA